LRSYFVKTPKLSSSSTFINKEIFKKTVLKTNNNKSSNSRWGGIWKWSKSKTNNSSNVSNINTKSNNKKTINNNNDNDSTWGIPTLRLRDHNGDIVPINPNTPIPIDTKYFKGNKYLRILIIVLILHKKVKFYSC
jgi:hypothetical protein